MEAYIQVVPRVLLAKKDHEAVSALLPELYKLRNVAELAPVMLSIVDRLIPSHFSTYNELNLRTGTVVLIYKPEKMREIAETVLPQASLHVGEHPIFRNVLLTGEGHPQLVSDYLSEEEWEKLEYTKASAPLKIADSLIFCLQTSAQYWIFLCINRSARDFTERDKLLAGLLRTHFSAAYDNSVAFTEAKAQALIIDQMIDLSPHGILLLDEAGQVLHMNTSAFDLLERYFHTKQSWSTSLPGPIQSWLRDQSQPLPTASRPLVIEAKDKHLVIRSSLSEPAHRIVLLREIQVADPSQRLKCLGLSKREAEVLHWISEGKSNSEIAAILYISPRTVGKHLETIFKKLKVETRMAAMVVATRGTVQT